MTRRDTRRDQFYAMALEKWGSALQHVKTVEECAELQKEICKLMLGDQSDERMEQIADEIADVRLMCEQVEYELKLQKRIELHSRLKVRRLKIMLGVKEDPAERKSRKRVKPTPVADPPAWVCTFERVREYPDCFQDCEHIDECKMPDNWKLTRPLPEFKS
jgi:hypothetical protein